MIPRRGGQRDIRVVSQLGLVLLAAVPLIAVTGLLSNAAYDPRVAGNVLAQGRVLGPLDFYLFTWPTRPAWLYAFTQGTHVSLGLAALPLVLAKLWSVLPGLFARRVPWTVASVLERLGVGLLVAGVLFEMFTGLFEIEYFFPFHAQLIAAHYYGAWVLIGAFVLHAAVKLPAAARGLRVRRELVSVQAGPDPAAAPVGPGPAPISRRVLLGTAAAGAAVLFVQGAAQAIGGPVRRLALLAPRGNTTGQGPNDFAVNGTAAAAGLGPEQLGSGWRLRISAGGSQRSLSRAQLLALPQHSYALPIACREGWSTTQRWTGVRLRDLGALLGAPGPRAVTLQALDGATATLAANQVGDERSLLALRVNGADLSPDHGYPARVIVPAAVGVTCLKWIDAMGFAAVEG